MKTDQVTYRNKSFEALFMNSLDAIVSIDANYCIVDINQAFIDLFGYTLKEIKGKHIDAVLNIGKAGSANQDLTAAILAGKQIEEEGVRYNKDGKPIDVLIKGFPILIDGKMAGAYGIYVDISERKRAEVVLKESEARNLAILSAIPDLMFIYRRDGVYLDYHAYDKSMLAAKPEDFLGRSVHEILPADVAELIMQCFEQAYKTRKTELIEYSLDLPDGRKFFEARITIMDEERLLAVVRDITERKLAEERILYISLHDDLTDLYNRNYLDEELKRLDTARQLPLSVIMADLNGLKLINDTYGHAVGDRALKCAADIIKKSCREEDIIARWGGDEFVILLPQTGAEEASSLCKRIADSCLEVSVKSVPVSMAIGIASKVDQKSDLNDILREAENGMYKQKLTESRSTKSTLLRTLLKTLEDKSFETETHARGMQEIAKKIGEKIKLPYAELNRLDLLITMHDIGKINIAEEILVKNGSLTPEEWGAIRRHPEIGFRIARATEDFAHIAEDILAHHECWDGSGYPRGISGEKIPLLARITAIADAYEVMKNGRPYKKAMTQKEINAEFKRCSGTYFDPALVKVFLSIRKK